MSTLYTDLVSTQRPLTVEEHAEMMIARDETFSIPLLAKPEDRWVILMGGDWIRPEGKEQNEKYELQDSALFNGSYANETLFEHGLVLRDSSVSVVRGFFILQMTVSIDVALYLETQKILDEVMREIERKSAAKCEAERSRRQK